MLTNNNDQTDWGSVPFDQTMKFSDHWRFLNAQMVSKVWSKVAFVDRYVQHVFNPTRLFLICRLGLDFTTAILRTDLMLKHKPEAAQLIAKLLMTNKFYRSACWRARFTE